MLVYFRSLYDVNADTRSAGTGLRLASMSTPWTRAVPALMMIVPADGSVAEMPSPSKFEPTPPTPRCTFR